MIEKKDRKGQSLMEIMIGVSISVIILSGLSDGLTVALRSNLYAQREAVASGLMQEIIDIANNISNADWNRIYNLTKAPSAHHFSPSGSIINIVAGTNVVSINNVNYTRSFTVENVLRNASGAIVLSGGSDNPSTQKVTARISFPVLGAAREITSVAYLTRFRNHSVRFSDWVAGSGVEGPVNSSNNGFSSSSANIVFNVSGQLTINDTIEGNLISSTFDTETGTAGAGLNYIVWRGSLNTGTVRFQLATANCPNGATNPPTCNSGVGWGGAKTSGDGAFVGTDGTAGTFYTMSGPGITARLGSHHNNKRHFRYRILVLRSGANPSPIIEDIIVNWSP